MKIFSLKKLMVSFLVLISVISLNSICADASWRRNSIGWWYTEGSSWATGWRLINGNWYYFYSNGYMAHDTTIDGYYLNSSGAWSNSYETAVNAQEYLNSMSIEHKRSKYKNCTDSDILNILKSNMCNHGSWE